MKKALLIAVPVLLLGVGCYAQFAGWMDVRDFISEPKEEKAVGVVCNLRKFEFDFGVGRAKHIFLLTLVCNDGVVLNLGVDYDNFAFKEGDRVEVSYIPKFENHIGEGGFKARWYPLRNYRLSPVEK